MHAIKHRLTTFEHKPDYLGMKLYQTLPETWDPEHPQIQIRS